MADVGRPSKYDEPSAIRSSTSWGRGFLFAFAGEISVARSTINEWINNHPGIFGKQ